MTWLKRAAPTLSILGAIWCVAAGALIWSTPLTYSRHGLRSTWRADSGWEEHEYRYTLQVPFSEASGAGPVVLLIPVGIALTAVWAAIRARLGVLVGMALLLGGLSFLAGFSIGGAYLPAAAFLLLAVVLAVCVDIRQLGSE